MLQLGHILSKPYRPPCFVPHGTTFERRSRLRKGARGSSLQGTSRCLLFPFATRCSSPLVADRFPLKTTTEYPVRKTLLHVHEWALGCARHISKDIANEWDAKHERSTAPHLGEISRLHHGFQRSISLLERSWQENPTLGVFERHFSNAGQIASALAALYGELSPLNGEPFFVTASSKFHAIITQLEEAIKGLRSK